MRYLRQISGIQKLLIERDGLAPLGVVESPLPRRRCESIRSLWKEIEMGADNVLRAIDCGATCRTWCCARSMHRTIKSTMPGMTSRRLRHRRVKCARCKSLSRSSVTRATRSSRPRDANTDGLARFTPPAMEYCGGVPAAVVPDNLKSGVTRAHRYDPDRREAVSN